MSNRARRRVLRTWRLRAVVEHYARMGWQLPEDFATLEEWNRWHRREFRRIWREPLRFLDNLRPDAGLVTIQIRNNPDRPFSLLDESLPDECSDSPIWPELASDFEHCRIVFMLARQGLDPLRRVRRRRFDWIEWGGHPAPRPGPDAFMLEPDEGDAEYIAPIQWAARAVRGRSDCLERHSEGQGYLHAAEICLCFPPWMKCRPGYPRLTDAEILFLLAMHYAREAADAMAMFAGIMLDEAEAAGIGRADYDALDKLREKLAALERRARRFYGRLLADARELLALAEQEAGRQAAAADSLRATSRKGGQQPKRSTGIQLLADELRKERPTASAQALFNLALTRCAAAGHIDAGGFRITVTPDGRLESRTPDGLPDRRPVDFDAWRKN